MKLIAKNSETVQIKNRFGEAIFECEIEVNDGDSRAVLLGRAVKAAISARANLTGANLSGANLSWANLREANLREANLSGANLREANLSWANLFDANLSWADLIGANLSGANLSAANLSDADLSAANLSGAELRCIGDMRHIRTMQFDKWAIGYTHTHLQIGCQRHEIDKWRKWPTPAGRRWISAMDDAALEWADRNLALVLAMIDANPAEPTGAPQK